MIPNDELPITPATEEDQELSLTPSIASQLPIRFVTGFSVETMGIDCPKCGKHIPTRQFNGIVKRVSISNVNVDMIGECEHCKMHSRANVMIVSDRHGNRVLYVDYDEEEKSRPIEHYKAPEIESAQVHRLTRTVFASSWRSMLVNLVDFLIHAVRGKNSKPKQV